jgi:signal transduction histidine kinase
MRKRLLISTIAVALVSVVLLGIPLGIVATRLIHAEAQKRINREALQIASAIDTSRNTSGPITESILDQLAPNDRYVVVRDADGTTLRAGKPIRGPIERGTMVDANNDVVTVEAAGKATNDELTTVWIGVVGLAVIALGAAVELARVQARRLAGPLEDLAISAERLGAGDPRRRNRRYGMPELDRVAEVLDHSAERIGELLGAERALAADASHQLRSPLTALSIRLEEIVAMSAEPNVRDEAAAALVQVERLAAVVNSLLVEHGRSSRGPSGAVVDIDAIIEQQRVEWEPAFRRAGRLWKLDGSTGLQVYATPAGLAQVVATLIDNALVHGAGTVSVHTRHSSGHVVLEVHDEGAGVADGLVPYIFERAFSSTQSTGLGLALARDLVAADGGRLELAQARPPIFAIFLASATQS